MTIHIQYDHTCPECGASYIPYGTSVRCPRCGVFEEEGRLIHYIEMAAHSCRNNFVYHGRFTPVAYATTTLSDVLLYWVFCLLDEFTAKGKPQSLTDFACDYASETEFTGQEYLRCCYQWYSRGSSASIFAILWSCCSIVGAA